MKNIERRDFIKNSTLAAGFLPVMQFKNVFDTDAAIDELEINIFSKHLQFLPFKELGKKAVELGFSGVDLTVRPGGHVEPKNVAEVLPKAIAEIKEAGSQCKIITTAIESTKNEFDRQILDTASKNGVRYYRCNWFKYAANEDMEDTLKRYQSEIKSLGRLNQKLGLVGCYQNHAGLSVGASIWEIKQLLATAVPANFGSQFDIRHAVVEGALSWQNGLRLIHSQIKSIVLKDFKWEKVNGQWKTINTPIGEGMIDFKKYFGLLKKYKINVPVSLHLEYDLGGAEHGHRELSKSQDVVYQAMKKDLAMVQKFWKEA